MRNVKDHKPPSTKTIYFWTKDSKIVHRGFFMKHANAFVRNVSRWKDIDTNKWYDDDEVIEWDYIQTYLEED